MGDKRPTSMFTGKPEAVRQKLNELVRHKNANTTFIGDDFILVTQTATGRSLRLSINKVIERMPKLGPPRRRYAIPCKPFIRTMDDCAWIDSALGPYVYGWECAYDGSFLPDNLGPIPDLTSGTESQFVKIWIRVAVGDPNIRTNSPTLVYHLEKDTSSGASVGGKAWLDTECQDGRIGDTRRIQNDAFNVTEGEGWFWKDDDTVRYKPNTDVSTLGAPITGIDISQTLDQEQGTGVGPPTWLFPVVGVLGVIQTAFPIDYHNFDLVKSNVGKTLERVN